MKQRILRTPLLTGGLIGSLAALLLILNPILNLILKSAAPVSMPHRFDPKPLTTVFFIQPLTIYPSYPFAVFNHLFTRI